MADYSTGQFVELTVADQFLEHVPLEVKLINKSFIFSVEKHHTGKGCLLSMRNVDNAYNLTYYVLDSYEEVKSKLLWDKKLSIGDGI